MISDHHIAPDPTPTVTGIIATQRGFTLLEVMVVIVILGIMDDNFFNSSYDRKMELEYRSFFVMK